MEFGVISFVAFCFVSGALLVAAIATRTRNEINSRLAADMLRGTIQHEAKVFLKALQSGSKYDASLRYLCNSVCFYVRLGGTFDALNERILTISTTLASKQHPVPSVEFCVGPAGHEALVDVGTNAQYKFSLVRSDSLVELATQ